jgi:hypothetical protein
VTLDEGVVRAAIGNRAARVRSSVQLTTSREYALSIIDSERRRISVMSASPELIQARDEESIFIVV